MSSSTVDWTIARCATGDASLLHLFFSEDEGEIAEAKAVCRPCPLRAPCLEGAALRGEPWGVWGGELFDRGRVIERKRPRGRPRKSAVEPAAATRKIVIAAEGDRELVEAGAGAA